MTIIILAAKEREKAQKLATQKRIAEASSTATSRTASPTGTPLKGPKGLKKSKPGTSTPLRVPTRSVDQGQFDISALNLGEKDEDSVFEEPPKTSIAKEKVLEEAKKSLDAEVKGGRKGVSLVVIGVYTVNTMCHLQQKIRVLFRSCRCRKIDAHGKVAL